MTSKMRINIFMFSLMLVSPLLSAQVAPFHQTHDLSFTSANRFAEDGTTFGETPSALGFTKGLSFNLALGNDFSPLRQDTVAVSLGGQIYKRLRLGLLMGWHGDMGQSYPFRSSALPLNDISQQHWNLAWQWSPRLTTTLVLTNTRQTSPTGQLSRDVSPALSFGFRPNKRWQLGLTVRGLTSSTPSPTPQTSLYLGFQPLQHIFLATDFTQQSRDYHPFRYGGPSRAGVSLSYQQPDIRISTRVGHDFSLPPNLNQETNISVSVGIPMGRLSAQAGLQLSEDGQTQGLFGLDFNSQRERSQSHTPDHTWQGLKLTGRLQLDVPAGSRLSQLFFGEQDTPLKVHQLLHEVTQAPPDGLVIFARDLQLSLADASYVRKVIHRLKSSHTRVIVHTDQLNDVLMLAFGLADELVMPAGHQVVLNGLHQSSTHIRRLMDKLGLQVHAFKRGQFKSAPEMFTHEHPSDATKEMRQAYLSNLHEFNRTRLSKDRALSPTETDAVYRDALYLSDNALQLKLIDTILTRDALLKRIKESNPDMKWALPRQRRNHSAVPQLAVLPLRGTIVSGRRQPASFFPSMQGPQVYDTDVIEELDQLKSNTGIQAILLYIDSPGGDAYASKRLWEHIRLIDKEKPVFAYIAGVGASGAYYIASAARKIMATPNAIVGSIGVYTLIPNATDFGQKNGIDQHQQGIGGPAEPTLFTPLTDATRSRLDHYIGTLYDDFVRSVSLTRQMTFEEVHAVAQGRVMSGQQAFAHHLVDYLGDFSDAISLASHHLNAKNIDVKPQLKLVSAHIQKPETTQPLVHLLSTFLNLSLAQQSPRPMFFNPFLALESPQ